jgi:hypothetical protein
MASSLFGNGSKSNVPATKINNIAGTANKISGLLGMLGSKDGNQMARNFAKMNPQFKKFYDENWNKPVEQIVKEYGLDMDTVNQVLGSLGIKL